LSGYIFSTNNTGTWENDSWVDFENQTGDAIFIDGFENGDFSAWTTTDTSGTGTVEVVSDVKYDGMFSSKIDSGTGYGRIRKSVGSQTDLYMRYYVMFESMPSLGGTFRHVEIGRLNVSNLLEVFLANVGGTVKWRIEFRNGSTFYEATSDQQTNPSPLTWYLVEARLKYGTTDGEYHVWINENELTDIAQTDKNTTFIPDTVNLYGQYFDTTVWHDRVVVSNSYIGPHTGWSNVTKTLNDTVGANVQWRVYANDTSNNWNASEIFELVTTSPSPCQVYINSLPYNITQNNTYYCLNTSSNNLAGTAIQFGNSSNWAIQNSTLDCLSFDNFIDGDSSGTDSGIYLLGSSTINNIIKNCNVTGFGYGISLNSQTSNNTLANIIANSNGYGILLYYANNNQLTNITANFNNEGIWIDNVYGNNISNSNFLNNSVLDVSMSAATDEHCNNALTDVNGTDNKPIVYYNDTVTIQNWDNNASEIILCNADNSVIDNVTLIRTDVETNTIMLMRTDYANVSNINVKDLQYGLYLRSSNNNNLTNINSSSNYYGIYVGYSGNNTITSGSIDSNSYDYGLYSIGETNYFTDTNFTAARRIYLYNVTSWFNYNNETTGDIWLKTNVSSAATITRELTSWSQSLIQWNDTNFTGTGITARYNITGLLSNTNYNIYNNSQFVQTLQTNADGNLPSFTVYLSDEHEIKVEEVTDITPPQIEFVDPTDQDNDHVNRDWSYVNVSITDDSNTSSFIDWNRSLVGYWAMDWYNASGIYDNSTYNNFGTFQGNLTIDNITTGKFGYGLEFLNSSLDHISVPDNPSLDITEYLTIELWIKLNSIWHTQFFVEKGQNDFDNYGFHMCNGDELSFEYRNVTGEYNHYSTQEGPQINLKPNIWYHVAVVFNKTHVKLYRNGSEVYVDKANGDLATNDNDLLIGKQNIGLSPRYFNGTMDEVRIWNRALSPEEINASYNSGVYRLYNNFINLNDGQYEYYAYAIDTAGNWNKTETRTLIVDTEAPKYWDNSTNNTVAGQPTLFSLNWTDNLGLSGYIFSTNNTGSWKNDTWVEFIKTKIGTSTKDTAVDSPRVHKSFYANGRYWIFYSNGSHMVYRTSTNNSVWS